MSLSVSSSSSSSSSTRRPPYKLETKGLLLLALLSMTRWFFLSKLELSNLTNRLSEPALPGSCRVHDGILRKVDAFVRVEEARLNPNELLVFFVKFLFMVAGKH